MIRVPAQDFDVLCDAVANMFHGEDRRRQVVVNCREHYDVGAADLLERIFRGDRSPEFYGGEHSADSGEGYSGNGTPDPFEVGEAILVHGGAGKTTAKIIEALGVERVGRAEWVGAENPDRTIRVIKMRNEPPGRDMTCAPRSFLPGGFKIVDLATTKEVPK